MSRPCARSSRPAPAPAPAGGPDTDYMNDGTTLSGTVLKQEFGKYVVIQMADGSQQTLDWSTVKRVSTGPRSAGATAPAAMPGQTGTPTVRTATGEAVTFTLAPVPKYSINFAFAGMLEYSSFGNQSMAGGGMEFAGFGIIGLTPFPDTHGGSWQGIAVQAFLRPWGGGIFGGDSSQQGGGFFSLNGGIGAGYSYLKINDIDLDYSQRGIGFQATWRFADENFWLFGLGNNSGAVNLSSFAHGPWIAVLFPTYAAHRGSLSYKFINADIVFASPGTGGVSVGITQFELGAGGAF